MKHNNLSLHEWKNAFELFNKVSAVEIDSRGEALILKISMPLYEDPKKNITETKRITLKNLNDRFSESIYEYTRDIIRNVLMEWRSFIYFENTLVAFFDIQAYSKFIKHKSLGECIKVLKKLFDNVAVNWGTGRRATGINIPHWVFSDSIIVALDTYIWPISRVPLRLFFASCSVVMGGAMESGLPLRGAIGGGNFCLYKNDNILISTALSDAADHERDQDWLGAVITPEAENIIKKYDNNFDSDDAITPYVKYGQIHWKRDSKRGRPEKLFYVKPLMNNPDWENYLPNYFDDVEKVANSQSLYR